MKAKLYAIKNNYHKLEVNFGDTVSFVRRFQYIKKLYEAEIFLYKF